MSAEETVVVDPKVALPESAAAVLPEVKADFGVDAFFEKIGKAPEAAAPKPVEKPVVVSADDAPPAPKGSIAAQFAAKNKPIAAKPAETVKPVEVAAPVVEPNPEDKLELDAKASTATREHFKTLKSVTKELRASVQQREQELADYKAKLEAASRAPSAAELERLAKLEAENKQFSDELLLTKTEKHPKFIAQFVEPKNQALAAAKELLGEKGSEVSKLLNLPRAELGKAVQELTKDMPDMDRLDVAASVRKAWELEQAGKDALAKAGDTYSSIRTKSAEEQKALFGQRFEKIAPSLAEHLVKLEAPANATPQQRQSVDAYNDAAASIRASAEKAALGAVDDDAVVLHATKSAAYDFHNQVMPRLMQEFSEQQEVIQGLTKELALYRGKNPNKSISPSLADSAPSSKPQSIEELADAHFKS